MNRSNDLLLTDLRYLIRDLAKNDGLIGPSVYDTAQVLRLAPPREGVEPALQWLIEQQQPDGGWGNPAVPRTRDTPTLAAILALQTYHHSKKQTRDIIQAGIRFLCGQGQYWPEPLPDELPVGVELLIPHLLDQAAILGLDIPGEQYNSLVRLGNRRRQMLAGRSIRAGTSPAHSWEALGVAPDLAVVDGSGGIGHNPAATAAWIHAATGREDLCAARSAAQAFLVRAAAATGVGIPGVVPTVWPITRFEQPNALYALLLGNILDHPALADVVQPQLDDLAHALTPKGVGFSDYFAPDGDDTVVTLAVLRATGRPADASIIELFAGGDHYCAYQGELQPSISVTAHAIHALEVFGHKSDHVHSYLVDRQYADGRWSGDKWNGSWLYTTSHAIVALSFTDRTDAVQRAAAALRIHQHADGGWGMHTSTAEETAYGVLAFAWLEQRGMLDDDSREVFNRGKAWLRRDYRPLIESNVACWIGKEIYRPRRLARSIELAATFHAANDS